MMRWQHSNESCWLVGNEIDCHYYTNMDSFDGSGEIYRPAVPTMLPRQKITAETFTFPENLQTEANIRAEKVICQWGTV